MSSCKEEDDGDGEAMDSTEGSTDMVMEVEEKEALFYLHPYVSPCNYLQSFSTFCHWHGLMHNFVHVYITFLSGLSLILSASQKKIVQDCEFALALTVTFPILLKVITSD
jgi:hypothetical protein